MIAYRHISTRDPEYLLEKELRNRVLRRPLGLELSEADLRGEDEQVHIAALDDAGRMIGCVLVAFTGEQAKIRQIAVDDAYRGRGVGAELMRHAEEAARARNFSTAVLHARVTARPFFEKLGYAAVSGVFTEVTIPHVEMRKDLH
jgi:predicted GNAT family N-acyltransferase